MVVFLFLFFLYILYKIVGGIELLYFLDKDIINLFIGKCLFYLLEVYCFRIFGVVINFLYRGYVNFRGFDFVEVLIWLLR